MKGEMIRFLEEDQTFEGYLARSVKGSGPGVIVIQEWWGLVGHIKSVVDRFAEAGFTALAPDFYQGQTAEEPDEAGTLMQALNIAETEKLLKGAIDFLVQESSVQGEKVGVVGFCMGGQLSLFAACVNPRIGACVNYYGIHPKVKPNLKNLQAPVLGFFADRDHMTTPDVVAQLDQELKDLNKIHEFITYPGCDHAFFNDTRPEVYAPGAAKDSWEKMTHFFAQELCS